MEKKEFKTYEKREFTKKEKDERAILGNLAYFFRMSDIEREYKDSNNWKFLTLDEYADRLRNAKSIAKYVFKNLAGDIVNGWNLLKVRGRVKDSETEVPEVYLPVYLYKDGKLAIPCYNNIIVGFKRFVGLSNLVYGLGKDMKNLKYFKHWEGIELVKDEELKKEVYKELMKPEKIDGKEFKANTKFTGITFDYTTIDKKGVRHKISKRDNVQYENEVKKPFKKPFEKKEGSKSFVDKSLSKYGKFNKRGNFDKKD